MALTFTIKSPDTGAIRTAKMDDGLVIADVEFTWSADGDYSSGFAIQAAAKNFGMHRVWHVVSAAVRQSNNTHRLLGYNWDYTAGKLRFLQGALAEVTSGTHIVVGDKCNMIVVGM